MLKIVFNDGKDVVASFQRVSDSVIAIGNKIEDISGFCAYRASDGMFLGDYSDYTTVYKVDDDGVQYSNDGSVYVEPEIPEIDESVVIETKPMTPQEEAANMSLADRVSQCEECILELSSVVYSE